ncbi:hypothetical protein ACIQ9Q_25395 [Streptomyces sp. NPDC094438]|uniref:hypothetical protein n=1 Tax=Streptomyces sp. NPDC094438 TaxID=3366061 RepID=UPI00380AB0B2
MRKQRTYTAECGDDEGVVWEPGEEAWETKLRAMATYWHAHGHLPPRQDATWPANGETTEPVPIGQVIANLRRPHDLSRRTHWTQQSEKQHKRLTRLGETPAEHPGPSSQQRQKTTRTTSAAFQRGIAALAQ